MEHLEQIFDEMTGTEDNTTIQPEATAEAVAEVKPETVQVPETPVSAKTEAKPVETVQPKKDETPEPDATKKSFLVETEEPLVEADDQPKGKSFVPSESHAIRRLKDDIKALKESIQQQANAKTAVDAESEELANLPDDEYLTVAQSRKLAQIEARRLMAARESELAEQHRRVQVQSRLLASENAFRQRVPDYDKVMQIAIEQEDVLTESDRKEAFASKDPAKSLYLIAKMKLSALGVDVPQPQKQTKTETNPPAVAKVADGTAQEVNEDEIPDEEFLDYLIASRGG